MRPASTVREALTLLLLGAPSLLLLMAETPTQRLRAAAGLVVGAIAVVRAWRSHRPDWRALLLPAAVGVVADAAAAASIGFT